MRSITDLMVMPGLINLDFADVRSVMSEMGKAMMGTGEGEGENRALEAAEQAIANPLLDGVSMAGAKGVIISIIGGEDMRLLEVDEAANHIRELVDEDANIIWGSAFNPDLKGKIRVSVVATGIEQGAASAYERPQSTSLSGSRAPKRPVLELSEDTGMAELPAVEDEDDDDAAGFSLTPPETAAEPAYEAEAEAEADSADEEAEAEVNYPVAEPFDLTGMQAGDNYGDEYEDDVDGIVDPLAGLRGADEALELGEEYLPYAGDEAGSTDGPVQDDLLANADRLAEEDRPVQARLGGSSSGGGRRRALLGGAAGEGDDGAGGGGGGGGAGTGAGSTLFERMANLSRSTARDDVEEEEDDDGDDDGPALSIPRFLGRQNNQ